jgi:hypothetical protein
VGEAVVSQASGVDGGAGGQVAQALGVPQGVQGLVVAEVGGGEGGEHGGVVAGEERGRV